MFYPKLIVWSPQRTPMPQMLLKITRTISITLVLCAVQYFDPGALVHLLDIL